MFARLSAVEIDGDKDREKSHLLRAHLAALLDGLDLGHVDASTFAILVECLREEAVDNYCLLDDSGAPTGVSLNAEIVWNCFVDAVQAASTKLHPTSDRPLALADTRHPGPDYLSEDLVTLSQLEFQIPAITSGANILGMDDLKSVTSADIAALAVDRTSLSNVIACINAGISSDNSLKANYLKGNAARITWVAPHGNRVQQLLANVDALGQTQEALDDLRNLLGLWCEDGKANRPLGAFHFKCSFGLCAPNVITASGYARFRHRPSSALPDAPTAGLTFNLDRAKADVYPGSCELVAAGLQLGLVTKVQMCGQPSPFGFSPARELKEHGFYGEMASGGRSLSGIANALEAHL